jgi:predicted RNA-binding Zn ribbon-like protein
VLALRQVDPVQSHQLDSFVAGELATGRYNSAMAKRTPPPRGPQLDLAGELSVAFVNTAGARPDNRQQGVETYADFVTWSQAVGTVSAPKAQRLRRRAAERPGSAQAAFGLVAELRTILAHSFLAAQRQEPADEGDFEAFHRALADSSLVPRLIAAESGAAWAWIADEDALDSPLAPVLASALKVMTAAEGRPHVRQCAAVGCRLFFLDRSGRRRWCAMKFCGNRAKVQSHYHRIGKAERQQLRDNVIAEIRRRSRPR